MNLFVKQLQKVNDQSWKVAHTVYEKFETTILCNIIAQSTKFHD